MKYLPFSPISAAAASSTTTSAAIDGTNGTPRTGLESRMKNITVNHFIKINN